MRGRANISIGDRVKEDYLGEGEVIKILKDLYGNAWGYLVMFDKTPDVRYNMGENPTLALDVEKINPPGTPVNPRGRV